MSVPITAETIFQVGPLPITNAYVNSTALMFAFLLASIGLLTVGINWIGVVWTRRSFNRLLTDFLRENPWALEENIQITKEIGELVGVETSRDSSIEEYVHNFKRKLRLVDDAE